MNVLNQIENENLIGIINTEKKSTNVECKNIIRTKRRQKNWMLIFVRKFVKIHKNKYDYSKINYINCHTKIKIICPIHGEFFQIPNDHLEGHGCKKCGTKSSGNNRSNNKKDFIEKSNVIHNNFYDYSKIGDYSMGHKKVCIICPIHGEFFQMAYSHLAGFGCKECKFETLSKLFSKSSDKFLEDCEKIHGNKYDYSNAKYINTHIDVEIICKKHGSFWQTPDAHLCGRQGCPKCRASKGESKIIKFLDENKINYITQKTFDDFRNPITNKMYQYDFYIPSKNLLVEYDGRQHFMVGSKFGSFITTENDLKDIQMRDEIKSEYAKQKGIKLVRIKYTEFKNIVPILEKEII